MTLQQQYNLIKEGKGDKAYFLKNAKFEFPNLFNAYTSYEDAATMLKAKGLITEGVGGVVTVGKDQDWIGIFKQNITEETKAVEKKTSKEVEDVLAHNYDYKDQKNIDNLNGQAFLHGFYTEMQDPKNEDKNTNQVKQIVAKNLAKDPLYYTKDGMFGLKGVGYTTEAPGLGTPKEPKGRYKSSGYGDLREGIENKKLKLQRIVKQGLKGLDLYRNTSSDGEELYYYDGDVLYSVRDDGSKGPSVRMSLFDITGLEGEEPENTFLKPGEKQTFKPIPSQADTAGDKLRASTARYSKLKEIIRELVLQELNEETPAADAIDNQIDTVKKQLGALYTKKGQELSKPGTGS